MPMKRKLLLLLLVLCALALCACAPNADVPPDPSVTDADVEAALANLDAFFAALAAGEVEEAAQTYSGNPSMLVEENPEESNTYALALAVYSQLSHTVKETKVAGKTIFVNTDITTIDLNQTMAALNAELQADEEMAELLGDMSTSKQQEYTQGLLATYIWEQAEADRVYLTTNFDIEMEYKKDAWRVTVDKKLLNALLGIED